MARASAHLASEGYAFCHGAVSQAVCALLRQDVLAVLSGVRRQPLYHFRRWGLSSDWVSIRAPWCRHVVPLPISVVLGSDGLTPLRTALGGLARAVAEGGLPLTATMVELSAAVTLPGAQAQDTHTDISAATPGFGEGSIAPLVTAWLAVQPILDATTGPTTVVPRSHRRLAVRSARLEREHFEDERVLGDMQSFSEPDIAFVERRRYQQSRLGPKAEALREDEERENREFGPATSATNLLLGCGDVVIMDCRVAHWGSAYPRPWWSWLPGTALTSQEPRVLINATFVAAGAEARHLRGFTYHKTSDLPTVTLGSLLTSSPSSSP